MPQNSWLDGYALPDVVPDDKKCVHACMEPPMDSFKVRCKHYVTKGHPRKGKKEPSSPAAFRLVSVFLVPAKKKIDHIVEGALGPSSELRLVAVFQVKVQDFAQHIVFLWERNPAADALVDQDDLKAFLGLLDQCVAPSSQLLADRLKILPFLSAGASFVMQKVVNNQPGQLAEALECKQYAGDGYVEVDVDIDAYKSASVFTKLAKAAVGMVYPQVACLTIDLAFMMAALTENELPERLLGAARLHKINLATRANMLGDKPPGRSILRQPSVSDAIREMRRSVSEKSHEIAERLDPEEARTLSAASDAGASRKTAPGTLQGGLDEQSAPARLTRLSEASTSSAGGRVRVKKRGVARQFQRFGHWVTNDHPEYEEPSELSKRGKESRRGGTKKALVAATPASTPATTPEPSAASGVGAAKPSKASPTAKASKGSPRAPPAAAPPAQAASAAAPPPASAPENGPADPPPFQLDCSSFAKCLTSVQTSLEQCAGKRPV